MPPSPQNQWRQKLIAEINGLNEIQNAERLTASTLNYNDTLMCLLDIYSRHSGLDRLLISPTGSKMQTVAVAIFRTFVRDVQIVYPTPRGFLRPDGYTLGVGPLYMISLTSFSPATVST